MDKGIAIQKGLRSFWHKALLIPLITAPIPQDAAQNIETNPKDRSLKFRVCIRYSTFSRTNSLVS